MEYLIFTLFSLLCFAWMWDRNAKAKRRLKKLSMPHAACEQTFARWRYLTFDRMTKANVAAAMFTVMPLLLVLIVMSLGALPGGESVAIFILIVSNFVWIFGPLVIAFLSARAGGKADALAKDLGFPKGVGWLAAKKQVRNSKFSPPKLD